MPICMVFWLKLSHMARRRVRPRPPAPRRQSGRAARWTRRCPRPPATTPGSRPPAAEQAQPLADVGHAVARVAPGAARLQPRPAPPRACPFRVLDLDEHPGRPPATRAASACGRACRSRSAVKQRVFHQRLQRKGGQMALHGLGLDLGLHPEGVFEAAPHDAQVVVRQRQLLARGTVPGPLLMLMRRYFDSAFTIHTPFSMSPSAIIHLITSSVL